MRQSTKDIVISWLASAALLSAGGVAVAQDQEKAPEKTWEKAKDSSAYTEEKMGEADKEAMEASELAPAAGKKAHEEEKEEQTPPNR